MSLVFIYNTDAKSKYTYMHTYIGHDGAEGEKYLKYIGLGHDC